MDFDTYFDRAQKIDREHRIFYHTIWSTLFTVQAQVDDWLEVDIHEYLGDNLDLQINPADFMAYLWELDAEGAILIVGAELAERQISPTITTTVLRLSLMSTEGDSSKYLDAVGEPNERLQKIEADNEGMDMPSPERFEKLWNEYMARQVKVNE